MDIRVSNGILYFSSEQMEEQIVLHGDEKEFRTREEVLKEIQNASRYSIVGYIGSDTLREWKGLRGGEKTYIVATSEDGYLICLPCGMVIY